MKVTVVVKPNSKIESINRNEDDTLTVRANATPTDGKANKRVIELLSDHFNRPKTSIKLLHGSTGKKKIFEIL